MPVPAAVQTALDAANGTALTGVAYDVIAQVGERAVTWRVTNKQDLKDTLTAAVNEPNFTSASFRAVPA